MMKQRSDYKRVYFCRIFRSASSTFTFGLYIFSLSVVSFAVLSTINLLIETNIESDNREYMSGSFQSKQNQEK